MSTPDSMTRTGISDAEFFRLRDFIHKQCGINLSVSKKILMESRLHKRLIALKLDTYTAYCNYVMSPAGLDSELVHMIDCIATNKTDFYREPGHFQFMTDVVIPEWLNAKAPHKPFKVWSSACSSGEEPYTIAMVLQDLAVRHGFDYRILATDISTKIVQQAIEAVYPESAAIPIPIEVKKRYLLRSKVTTPPTVRIVPQLRAKVQFRRLNLMDTVLDVDKDFDLVFCRNLLIYFDRATQERVLQKLASKLKPGGYLFIGHSESIYAMNLPLQQVRPTVFQRV